MEKKKCYVSGCTTVGGKLYRIPINETRAETWRRFCLNPILDKYPLRKLNRSFQICIKHFAVDAFTYPSSEKLLRCAAPTLFPPTVEPFQPPVASPPHPTASTSIDYEPLPSTAELLVPDPPGFLVPHPPQTPAVLIDSLSSPDQPQPSSALPVPLTSLPNPTPTTTQGNESALLSAPDPGQPTTSSASSISSFSYPPPIASTSFSLISFTSNDNEPLPSIAEEHVPDPPQTPAVLIDSLSSPDQPQPSSALPVPLTSPLNPTPTTTQGNESALLSAPDPGQPTTSFANSISSFSYPPPIASTSFSLISSAATPSPTLSPTPGSSSVSTKQILGTPKRKRPRTSILQSLGVTRIGQLTPRKKLLADNLTKTKRKLQRMKRLSSKYRKDIQGLTDVTKSDFMMSFEKSLSPSSLLLVRSILRHDMKKPKGRRWTHPEKVMALSLYKKGPKSYRFLRNFMPLPVKSTLMSLLKTIPLRTGINDEIFCHLKSVVMKLKNKNDQFCALLFDEVWIRPQLTYNAEEDNICGYVDQGSLGREGAMAKQALVFMIRGVRARWKQPLSFYLSHGSTHATNLSELIKETLSAVANIGLKVIATVCDMGATNVKALSILGANYSSPFFEHEGLRIVTIFDPPHLLKSFRNLFLTHKVRVPVTVFGQQKILIAEWEHLRTLARDDLSVTYLPLSLFNLTQKHLAPSSREKMRVDIAAKVFSRHVAAGIHMLVGKNVLGMNGLATAEFLMEVNDLFDSMNGSNKEVDKSKMLKNAVTQDSPHLQFWSKMERKLQAWQFLRKRRVHPPSQDGWLASIRGMRMLWRKLNEEGFLHMNPLNFNQDPLENFFNVIRQNCGGNHFPNARQFQHAFKTALLNNLMSNQTPGNTKEDGCAMLSNIASFFSPEGEGSGYTNQISGRERPSILLPDAKIVSIVEVCSSFVKYYLKNCCCNACRHLLLDEVSATEDVYTSFLFEGLGQVEVGPSQKLTTVARSVFLVVRSVLEKEGHKPNVSLIVQHAVGNCSDLSGLSCDNHSKEFKDHFLHYMPLIGIRKFCIEENKKLLPVIQEVIQTLPL